MRHTYRLATCLLVLCALLFAPNLVAQRYCLGGKMVGGSGPQFSIDDSIEVTVTVVSGTISCGSAIFRTAQVITDIQSGTRHWSDAGVSSRGQIHFVFHPENGTTAIMLTDSGGLISASKTGLDDSIRVFFGASYLGNLIDGGVPSSLPPPLPTQAGASSNLQFFLQTNRGNVSLAYDGDFCAAGHCVPPNHAFILPVKPRHQETHHWCWAAVGEMVMNYLRPSLNVSQCQEANREFNPGAIDCCKAPLSAACYKPAFPPFQQYGFTYSTNEKPLSFEAVEQEIGCAKRPVVVHWTHRGSSEAHFVLAIAYDPNRDGMQQVGIVDPELSDKDDAISQLIPYSNWALRQFTGGFLESESYDIYKIMYAPTN